MLRKLSSDEGLAHLIESGVVVSKLGVHNMKADIHRWLKTRHRNLTSNYLPQRTVCANDWLSVSYKLGHQLPSPDSALSQDDLRKELEPRGKLSLFLEAYQDDILRDADASVASDITQLTPECFSVGRYRSCSSLLSLDGTVMASNKSDAPDVDNVVTMGRSLSSHDFVSVNFSGDDNGFAQIVEFWGIDVSGLDENIVKLEACLIQWLEPNGNAFDVINSPQYALTFKQLVSMDSISGRIFVAHPKCSCPSDRIDDSHDAASNLSLSREKVRHRPGSLFYVSQAFIRAYGGPLAISQGRPRHDDIQIVDTDILMTEQTS